MSGRNTQPCSLYKTDDLTSIEMLDREQCTYQWRRLLGSTPPRYTSVEFMRKVLTYEAQIKSFGGHSKAVLKALKRSLKAAQNGPSVKSEMGHVSDEDGKGIQHQEKRISNKTDSKTSKSKPSIFSIRVGTHLVREWNGRTYQVEAVEGGFKLDGKTYRSLTATAKKITGAHWSGPRFFGLES